jgi:hypothetical protein
MINLYIVFIVILSFVNLFLLVLILLIINKILLDEYDLMEEENIHRDMRGIIR